jgi:hypothetical protein
MSAVLALFAIVMVSGAVGVHPALAQTSPIDEKYLALGGGASFLGQPEIGERITPDGIGRFRHFQGGSIYWHPDTGAHEVHGAIRGKWTELGWEKGFLGYPVTDELTTPDGAGRFNHFQGGSIYWHPNTGAHEVHGAIRAKWAELGWETSRLRYPISDEEAASGEVRVSRFQRGEIRWHPSTGTVIYYTPLPSLSAGRPVAGVSKSSPASEDCPGKGDPCQVHPRECIGRGADWVVSGTIQCKNGIPKCEATAGKDYCNRCGGDCGRCWGESCSSAHLCIPGSICQFYKVSLNAPGSYQCRNIGKTCSGLGCIGCTPIHNLCWTKQEVGKPQVGCVEGQQK